MKIIQVNLNHCEAAQSLLHQTALEEKVDVIVISEQYKNEDSVLWQSDTTGTSAIWTANGLAQQHITSSSKGGFVRSVIGDLAIYSCYIPPRYGLVEFNQIVDSIAQDASKFDKVLIAGDFNAWAVEWGCPRTNPRGRSLLEAFARLDITLMNRGEQFTFERNGCGSIIDIAFASSKLATQMTWKISDIYTHSDHKAIFMDIRNPQKSSFKLKKPQLTGWKRNFFDREMFLACLTSENFEGPAEEMANKLIKKVTNACDMSMHRRKHNGRRNPVYWWNDDIANLRKECISARRKFSRSRGQPWNHIDHADLKLKKKKLKDSIKSSKRKCFVDICQDLDDNPFGLAYKIAMKKLKSNNPVAPTEAAALDRIVTHLFPRQRQVIWNKIPADNIGAIPQISDAEIIEAGQKLQTQKAPGLDGIPNTVVKETTRSNTEYLRQVFNNCLKQSIFPSIWKKQKLLLLPKGNKPLEDPSSFRPICLIDAFGKLFEAIICKRLSDYVESQGALSDNQFGFRKGRSTIDAINILVSTALRAIHRKSFGNDYCIIVTLDVKNAFNSANWEQIIKALERINVPNYLVAIVQNYFTNRVVIYDTEEGRRQYAMSGGVPQGSVLGPLLWNIMYDGILRLRLPEDAQIIGFADDIALVVTASSKEAAKVTADASIYLVNEWLTSMGLTLAEQKTEAVLISSRRNMNGLVLKIGESEIFTTDSLKYLGVVIDRRLSFKPHLRFISEKARKYMLSLSRIMPNTKGPKFARRKILGSVIKSVILYSSPIWASSLKYKCHRDNLNSAYRLCALRVCCSYRTVSDEAAFVIAGMMPVDLLATESMFIYYKNLSKNEARKVSLDTWQKQWTVSSKGRWTHQLIPDIQTWIERKHGDVDFFTTQFLSGHGPFRHYLYRFGLSNCPLCPCCNIVEDAHHVFFDCPRFDLNRSCLKMEIGLDIRSDNIIGIMISSLASWELIANYVKLVLLELVRLQ